MAIKQRCFTLEEAYLQVVKHIRPNQAIVQSTENDQLHLYELNDRAPGVVVMMFGRAYKFVRYMEPSEVEMSDGI